MSAPVDSPAPPAEADTDAALGAIVERCAEGLDALPEARKGVGLLTVVMTLISGGLEAMDAEGRRQAFHILMRHLLGIGLEHGLIRNAAGCGDPGCEHCKGEAGETRPVMN